MPTEVSSDKAKSTHGKGIFGIVTLSSSKEVNQAPTKRKILPLFVLVQLCVLFSPSLFTRHLLLFGPVAKNSAVLQRDSSTLRPKRITNNLTEFCDFCDSRVDTLRRSSPFLASEKMREISQVWWV